ncbi:MAG: NAD-dependent epimerase [Pseudorhodoplanes sp.]
MTGNETIVVTGSAGFIGFHVAQRLLQAGHRVVGIDNMSPYYDVTLKEARRDRLKQHPHYSDYEFDLADGGKVSEAFRTHRPGRVIHLAAQAGVRYSLDHPRSYTHSNIEGFLSIIEACRHFGVRHLVFASTSSVYGANTAMPFSEHDGVGHPLTIYAATKRANELMAHSYSHLFGIPMTGLRFFTVYGPWGRPDMALFKFTRAILAGEPIEVFNNGEMERDLTYVDDLVEGIVRVVQVIPAVNAQWDGAHPDPGSSGVAPFRIYNIGNAQPVNLMRYIEAIERSVGRTAKKTFLPMQPGDVPRTFADTAALKTATGFSPSTPVEEGVQRFVDWYCDYYRVKRPG